MTIKQALETLRQQTRGNATAGAALDALQEEIDLIRRRYADKECVRLGHILRHALPPEQYYRAEQAARAEHPEAWAGRQPAEWAGRDGGAA
jgi:hypothetical protein